MLVSHHVRHDMERNGMAWHYVAWQVSKLAKVERKQADVKADDLRQMFLAMTEEVGGGGGGGGGCRACRAD